MLTSMPGNLTARSNASDNIQIDASDLAHVVQEHTNGRTLMLVDKGGRVVGVWPEPSPTAPPAVAPPPPPPNGAPMHPHQLLTQEASQRAWRVTSHGQVVSSDGQGTTYHLAEIHQVDERAPAAEMPRPPHLQASEVPFANAGAAANAAALAAAGTFTAGASTFTAGSSPSRRLRRRHRGAGPIAASGTRDDGVESDCRRVCQSSARTSAASGVVASAVAPLVQPAVGAPAYADVASTHPPIAASWGIPPPAPSAQLMASLPPPHLPLRISATPAPLPPYGAPAATGAMGYAAPPVVPPMMLPMGGGGVPTAVATAIPTATRATMPPIAGMRPAMTPARTSAMIPAMSLPTALHPTIPATMAGANLAIAPAVTMAAAFAQPRSPPLAGWLAAAPTPSPMSSPMPYREMSQGMGPGMGQGMGPGMVLPIAEQQRRVAAHLAGALMLPTGPSLPHPSALTGAAGQQAAAPLTLPLPTHAQPQTMLLNPSASAPVLPVLPVLPDTNTLVAAALHAGSRVGASRVASAGGASPDGGVRADASGASAAVAATSGLRAQGGHTGCPSAGQAAGVVWDVYKTSNTAYYMEAGDPNPVLIEPLPAGHVNAPPPLLPPPRPPPGSRVAIGLVSMTKQPHDLLTWLTYHHSTVGVCCFFIKVEDTPELAALFATPPWDQLVVPTFDDGTQRDYFAQMDRQTAHIANTLPLARNLGLTHLLHIDDDELIYCSHGAERLHAELACAGPDRPDCHMYNVEALLPSSNCRCPFREATCFRHLPTRYVSYTNGKSIGRLDAPSLRSHGPHHFRTNEAAGGKGSAVTHQIGADVAVVLHYESATYAKWHSKYLDLAAQHGADPEVYARVPFAFYRKSMAAAYAILCARRSGDAATEAEAVAASHALWCEHKLAPRGLPAPTQRPRRVADGLTVLWPFFGDGDGSGKHAV